MPATFNPDLSDPVSRVRLDLGDTDVAAAMLEDETITAMLARHGADERLATISLASALVARYAQEPDKVDLAQGEGGVQWTARLKGWQGLIGRLQSELAATAGQARPGFRTLRPKRYGEEPGEYSARRRCW